MARGRSGLAEMEELLCQGIYASYRDRSVLSGVDLSVGAGTLTAILGASGSGKTTLLRVIMGFVAADAGSVTLGSRVVAEPGRVHVPPSQRAVAYVAQEGALFPHLDVAANVGFGLPRSERQDGTRVDAVLDLVGLDRSYEAVGRTSCPEVSSAASRWRGHSHHGRRWCCSTSRSLALTRRCVLRRAPQWSVHLRPPARPPAVTHDQREALSTGDEVAVLRDGQLCRRHRQRRIPDACRPRRGALCRRGRGRAR